eukprot:GDKJ01049010.1.p1 GENE.GDKJ01049010.1~~GDKJ01049010.1.p1  ORF type:complete len:518 (-),score=88.58 GDKJ01049010.1:173-1726(-)
MRLHASSDMASSEQRVFQAIARNPPKGLFFNSTNSSTHNSLLFYISRFWHGFSTFLLNEVSHCRIVDVKGLGKFFLSSASDSFVSNYATREAVNFFPSTNLSAICAGALSTHVNYNMLSSVAEMKGNHIAAFCDVPANDCKILFESFLVELCKLIESGVEVSLNFGEVGCLSLSQRSLMFSPGFLKPQPSQYETTQFINANRCGTSSFNKKKVQEPCSTVPTLNLRAVSGYTGVLPLSARANLISSSRLHRDNEKNDLLNSSRGFKRRDEPAIETSVAEFRPGHYFSARGPALPWINFESWTNKDLEKRMYRRQKGAGVEVNSCDPYAYVQQNFNNAAMKRQEYNKTLDHEKETDQNILENAHQLLLSDISKMYGKRQVAHALAEEQRHVAETQSRRVDVSAKARELSDFYQGVVEKEKNSFFPFVGSEQSQTKTRMLNNERKTDYDNCKKNFEKQEGAVGLLFGSPTRKGKIKIPLIKLHDENELRKREAQSSFNFLDKGNKNFIPLSFQNTLLSE